MTGNDTNPKPQQRVQMCFNPNSTTNARRMKKKLTSRWLYPEVVSLSFNYTRLDKITGYLGKMAAQRMAAVVRKPGCCLGSWYEKLPFPSV